MPSRKSLVKSKSSNLTQRQTQLLFALIKEYCDSGQTIGSKELKEKYKFTFSPATIRNELAILRENGYLYQPFINSSSCPTEKAFKLFISQLINGLGYANKQQIKLREEILALQQKQSVLTKEIARLVSTQTEALGFSVSKTNESISGIKHLLENKEQASVVEVLEFLDNLPEHKQLMLESDENNNNKITEKKHSRKSRGKNQIQTVFGGDKNVLPLGKGYTMISTKVKIDKEDTVIGIISPTHLLTNPKKLEIIETISQLFSTEEDEETEDNF